MSVDLSPLFNPLKVKDKEIPNRIVMPPMVTVRGIITPEGITWYSARARGGAGLVIVEATSVNKFGTDFTVETLKPLVDAIHQGGALAAIQLFPVTFDFPSTVEPPTPDELDQAGIDAILADYGRAAAICAEAGFDGIQPHGAHGYLINQFFSQEKNTRTDQYGGSLENRMRFGLSIVNTVKPACSDGMLLLYRHTPVGKAYDMDDSLTFCSKLVEAGVDILDISPSSDEVPGDRAEPFKRFGVPVIAVGALDVPERAAEVLAEDRADLVAIGRGLIADAYLPKKMKDGRLHEIIECTKCDELCFGNLRQGVPIACVEWH
jgi:NADPH2 dehydrogenase